MHPKVLSRCPELLPQAAWIFRAYLELDRDGFNGRVLFAGMCAVLDEYGITERPERERIRGFWRSMYAAEAEVREDQEKRRKEREAEREAAKRMGKPSRKRPAEDIVVDG